jgi:hypothetical protein
MLLRRQHFQDDLREQPFQPFRLTLTDGLTYEVLHPELAMVGRSTVAIGMARPDAPEPVNDRLVTVSLSHDMQIQPIVSASAP